MAGHPVVHVLADLHASDPAAPRAATRPAARRARRRGGGAGRRRRRRAAARRRGRDAPPGPRGVDVILHNLSTGRTSCSAASATSRSTSTGDLLAYTVDAAVKDGNGLFVFDARNGRITPLDNDAQELQPPDVERGRHGARGAEGRRRREDARARQRAARVPERAAALAIGEAPRSAGDPRSGEGGRLPQGLGRQRPRARSTWSDDNKRVFFGIKEQVAGARHRRAASTDEAADVDVWNTRGRADPVAADDPRRDQIATSRSARRSTSSARQVRQAGRRDDARSRRRAGRPLGGRPRHARLHPRLQAAGRGHLPRQHDDRRAHADAEGASSTGSTCSASRPTAGTSSTGRTTSSRPTTSTPATTRTLGDGGAVELRRHGVRSSGPEAVVRHRRLHAATARRRSSQHRYDLWLLPLDGIGAEEPHQRRRREERDPLPLRPHASRDRMPGGVRPRGGGGPARARRSTCRSRSRCRRTASTRRRPASTSWRTDS